MKKGCDNISFVREVLGEFIDLKMTTKTEARDFGMKQLNELSSGKPNQGDLIIIKDKSGKK